MSIFFLIIVLFSSAVVLSELSLKIIEIKTGKLTPLGRLSTITDPFLTEYVKKGKHLSLKLNTVNFKKTLVYLSHSFFHAVGTAGLFVSKHYKDISERLNGRRKLEKRGIVSFFLKDVAESKGERKDDMSI